MGEAEIFGRCMCGLVRFRIVGDVADAFYCHCESCRRSSGAPVVAWGRVNESQFSLVKGTLSNFNSSPAVTRSRCGQCGTEIIYRHQDEKPNMDFPLATLEVPDTVKPAYHVRFGEKLSWVDFKDALAKYDGWRPKPSP